jgi:gamma-glutamyltranspeptidase/glutathione hydrolase
MTPTILTKDGRPVIIIGAQGGRTIINTVLQIILNVIDHKMSIAQAVEAPRMHHQWLPDQITVEPYWLSKDTKAILIQRGCKINELQFGMGDAMGIMVNSTTNELMGAADSRSSDGGAVGF